MKASQAANAIVKYAEWCGGVHDDGCPADDTCDCSGKWINDGVTDAVTLLRAQDDLLWALDNVYTIARRELTTARRNMGDERTRDMWGHVLRLCEKAGCQSRGVLRDSSLDPVTRDQGTQG